ncbi:MAG TPA: MarR family transcriptional regulator [Acholeplasmataceae bacterium]|nr:MarR family transcriptional regulator [Acholeplasmataceae bacterium]HBO67845.1 MarR family transcriptional regulator [Acholeplasmataceae bacterium]HBS02173.1 MarR family transcriptional regulator [Acholeplasmataceae bacterium]HCB20980.1 MarR family transcriptional regulator [Acholeplasmataceae bacterium]
MKLVNKMQRDKDFLKLTTVLFRTMQHVEAVIKQDIQSYQLNTSEFGALELLYNRGAQPMQSIASRTLMANSSMTYVIDKLESRKLIYRKQDEKDKRVMIVDLTDEGRTFFECIFEHHIIALKNLYGHLTDEELTLLIQTLKKVGYKAKELQGEKS